MVGILIIGVLLAACVILRQIDRIWFSQRRPRSLWFGKSTPVSGVQDIKRLQHQRINDVTPTLLAIGHWLEILAWAALCTYVPLFLLPIVCIVAAVKFRQLQELTHFAVHRSLARTRRCNDLLGELIFQAPLVMPPLDRRRETHVVQHHPNATDPQLDPNLGTLYAVGLGPSCRRLQFVRGIVYPLTLSGMWETARQLCANARCPRSVRYVRCLPIVVILLVAAVGGVRGVITVLVVPRLVLYPYLSWMSLLVEHRWFSAPAPQPTRQALEAERCVRLYRTRRILEAVARMTWLPYGDIFHYAHSVYPSIRWNYLRDVDKMLAFPRSSYSAVFWGRSSVIAGLYQDTVTPVLVQSVATRS